jgi:hypothetical protein
LGGSVIILGWEQIMTYFQIAVLALLALNGWITYRMLRRLAIASLVGSFVVAHWLNPVRAEWFKENYKNSLAAQDNDAKYQGLAAQLAEENPECPLGRESLIASAFDAYTECLRVPEKYRKSKLRVSL